MVYRVDSKSRMSKATESDSELESLDVESVSGGPFLAEESGAFSDEPPKRGRGRPRKDGAPTGSRKAVASDVPGPRFTSFYSDHHNPNQKTRAAWTWWNQLPGPMKDLIDVHVYRDWPVLLDPPEGSDEKKYVDKVIGTQPFQNDQDFIDRWGAGDYHCYVNVNPITGPRRTLMTCYVKGSHDFKTYIPTDRRIDNIDNLSLTDPANAAYVAWLKANGKVKDVAKETENMAANASATAGLSEIAVKALDRGDRLMEKLIEKENAPAPPLDPPPSAEEKLNESLTLLEKLQNFTKGPTSDPLQMMTVIVETAKVIAGSNDPSKYMDRITALEEKLRTTESEMLRGQLTEIKEQLRTIKETPPASNVLLPDGSNLNAVIEKAVAKAFDAGVPEDTAWYVEPLKQLLPAAVPALMLGLQRLMSPTPNAPILLPPPNFQAGQPQAQIQPQSQQLPPPQPQAQAQPQVPQPNAEEVEINRVLTAISAPVIEALSNEDGGDQFADWVREEFGASSQRLLAKFSEQEISAALYMFPLTAQRMTQFQQGRVAKFVSEFKNYDRDAFDKKLEAEEKKI